MRPLKLSFTFLASVLLLGCASSPGALQPTDPLDPGKGVVVVSLTSSDSPQVMDAWFFYRKKGSTEDLRLDAFGVGGLLAKPKGFADEPSRRGRLQALALDPGEYELFNWTLYVTRAGGYGYLSPKVPPPPHGFVVRAGELAYLGNLHIEPVLGKNTFGIPMVFGGEPEITDRSDRDLPLLKIQQPRLAAWPLRSQVPSGALWKVAPAP